MKYEETAVMYIVVQLGKSPFLWGPVGQGKSSAVRKGFRKLGYKVHVIRMNTILPHYFSGQSEPNPNGRGHKYTAPEWVHELNEAEKSILFMDDLTLAPPLLQNSGLGLLEPDDRRIGDTPLKAVPIIAGNPNTLATQRFNPDATAVNRCVHIRITSDAESFKRASENGFPVPPVPVVNAGWKDRIPVHRNRINEFLTTAGKALVNAQPEQINENTVAFPTERAWETLWESLAAYDSIDPETAKTLDLPAVKRLLFQGCVGEGAYKAFVQHVITPMETDAMTALKQGKNFVFPTNGDKVFGLLSAVSSKLDGGKLTEANWVSAWGLLEALDKDGHLDRGYTFAQDLISLGADKFALPQFYRAKLLPRLSGK